MGDIADELREQEDRLACGLDSIYEDDSDDSREGLIELGIIKDKTLKIKTKKYTGVKMDTNEPKVKEIYVEAKKSKNFQTYTVGMTATVNSELTFEELKPKIAQLQARCRRMTMEQSHIDSK